MTGCRYNAQVVFIFSYDNEVAACHNRWGGEPWSFGVEDVCSALVQMMLKATDLGLETCWVGAFDDTALREEFDMPANLTPRALLPMGIPSEKGAPSPRHTERIPLEEMATWL